jgi:hypothetical protein
MKRLTLIPAAALLALAACNPPSEPNAADPGELNIDAADIEPMPPSEAPGPGANGNATANEDMPVPLTVIPAAFHGRWGMGPADCTSTRGDAKGLIAVDANSIKFYESRATLAKVTMNAPENFTGDFKFTGEGQTWTKPQNLKLTGSSNTLIRSETEPAMSFTYKRCTA